MARNAAKNTVAGRDQKDDRSTLGVGRRRRISELLQQIEERLDIAKLRFTLADFIRLTQLERELEREEQPREIIVTWKEPSEGPAG